MRYLVFLLSSLSDEVAFDPFPLKEPGPHVVEDNRFLGEFFYMLLMLALLIGVVMLAGYVLRKITSTRNEALNTTNRVKILERRALSQKTQIHIIQVDDKEYVVAESSSGIGLLPLKDTCQDTSS